MIKHLITTKNEPVKHSTDVSIKRNLKSYIKRCLTVDSLEEMSDESLEAWSYKKNSFTPVFEAKFDDGSVLTWDLCSGNSNYYDDVIFYDKNGKQHTLDCTYEFEDIIVETDTDIYKVNIKEIQ